MPRASAYLRSEVSRAQIRDGSSVTYLVGEKYVHSRFDPGDDQSIYSGYDYDTFCWGKPHSPPLMDSSQQAPSIFGSAHPTSCNFMFCDGSAKTISYAIDPEVHRRLSNRQDGLIIDEGVIR